MSLGSLIPPSSAWRQLSILFGIMMLAVLMQKRQWGPELAEEDPAWLRVGRLADFKVRRSLFQSHPSHHL